MKNTKQLFVVLSILLLLILKPALAQSSQLSLPSGTNKVTVSSESSPEAYWVVNLSGVPPGFDVGNGTCLAWCLDPSIPILQNNPYDAWLYSSIGSALPGDYSAADWKAVNYILNNKAALKQSFSATSYEMQHAIWRFVLGHYATSRPPSKATAIVTYVSANGLNFVPGPGQVAGVLVDLDDYDLLGHAEIAQDLLIEVPVPTPLAVGCASGTGEVGLPLSGSLSAVGGQKPYTFSIISGALPDGLSLDTSSGAISGTPTVAGPFTYTAQVMDALGRTATTSDGNCAITILPQVDLLCVSGTGEVGVPFTMTLTATGGQEPYTYSIVSGLPDGLSLDASSGVVSGLPTTAGTFTYIAQVTDSFGVQVTASIGVCGITVLPQVGLACVSGTTEVGLPFTAKLTAVDGQEPYTYSIVSGLPDGLTLDAQTGVISGIPTTAGSFNYVAQVTDNLGQKVTASVGTCGITVLTPVSLACVSGTGEVGLPFTMKLTAAGGQEPYTYSIVSGLPDGLTLDSKTGIISGTPTTAGSFTYVAQVTDNLGLKVTASVGTCGITVLSKLELACASGTGEVDKPMSLTLSTSGGQGPFDYTITAGSLPGGLVLNPSTGTISGTPTDAGTFNYTAQVKDALGAIATTTGGNCSITITKPCTVTVTCPPDTTVNGGSGSYLTFTQGGWGSCANGNNPGAWLAKYFCSVYTGGFVEVGIPGASGYSMKFTSAAAIKCYLPAGGTPATLNKDASNPTCSSAGVFGGQVMALQLNVDFGNKGYLPTGYQGIGDLVLSDPSSPLNGKTVSEILAIANFALGGGQISSYGITISQLNDLVTSLNEGWDCGTTTAWAASHISSGIAGTDPSVTGTATATDSCGDTLTTTYTDTTTVDSTTGSTIITRTWTAANLHGTSTCAQRITVVKSSPVALSCVSTTVGQVGTAYSSALSAIGGTAPYTYSIAAGSLPPGLSLNSASGVIFGTPTTAGTFSFTAKVVDALGTSAANMATACCSITVNPPPCYASLCGVVLRDCNADGYLCYEQGLVGFIVQLKNSAGAIVGTATTANDGSYCFNSLAAGNYTVEVTPLANYRVTVDPDCSLNGKACVSLAACQNKTGVNFGYTGTAPGVNVVVTGPATAKVGETITYTFTISNTGNTCLYGGMSVVDPLLGGQIWHQTPIVPGESYVFTKTYVVKCSDPTSLVNTATGVGHPPGGLAVVTSTATCTTTITKTVLAAPTGLAATPGCDDVDLTWNCVSGATSYKVKRSATAGGPYTVIKSGLTSRCFSDTCVTSGNVYFYVVSAVCGTTESSDSAEVAAIPSYGLPCPWQTKDIGPVAATGGASFDWWSWELTQVGSGTDIWNCADEFRYSYIPAGGNCTIVARVVSVGNTDPWAKAGVMIRETLNQDSKHASVFVTPQNGVAFQYRNCTSGGSGDTHTTGLAAPYWVKVVRSGNTFTAYRSTNGYCWTNMGSQTISMSSCVYIGLAVTSHNDGAYCTAVIDNVTATP